MCSDITATVTTITHHPLHRRRDRPQTLYGTPNKAPESRRSATLDQAFRFGASSVPTDPQLPGLDKRIEPEESNHTIGALL